MSTTYGEVRLRDGSALEVEAFGASAAVKLVHVRPQRADREIALNDPGEIDALISLLQIARDHVWDAT